MCNIILVGGKDMKKNDRISALCKAAEAMARGDFTPDIPIGDDEIGHLGKSLKKLSSYLKKQSERSQSLYRIMVECNLNLQLIDVLNHIYESFRDHLPYDRISLALLESDGSKLKLHWSRADYDKQELITGLAITMSDSGLRAIIDINEMLIIRGITSQMMFISLAICGSPTSQKTRRMICVRRWILW